MIQLFVLYGHVILLTEEHEAQIYGQKAEYLTENRGVLLISTSWDAVLLHVCK